MKYAFLLGLLLGVAGVVAAAAWAPGVDHPRLRSETSVLPNGGREEVFDVRPPAMAALQGAGGGSATFALYKLRNGDGEVIGVASRLAADASAADWCLVLPARGALFLRREDREAGRIVHGTAEFAGADGRFEESSGDPAAPNGTIELRVTLTRAS